MKYKNYERVMILSKNNNNVMLIIYSVGIKKLNNSALYTRQKDDV